MSGPHVGTTTRAPRSPLRSAGFRHLVLAAGSSNLGTGVEVVAVGWLALRLTHSAALVGVLGFLVLAPQAVLSETGGALAARFAPKRMGVILYSIRVLPSGLLALAGWAGRITYADLAVVSLVNGALGALAGVDLQDLLRNTPRVRLRGVLTKVDVRSLLVTVAIFGLVAAPIGSLLSVVARHYSAGADALGELLAALAAGGLVASLALTVLERKKLSHRHVLDSTLVVCGASIAIIATLPPFPVQLLALGLLGGSIAVLYSVSLSWIQLSDSEPEVTARMVGVFFALLAGCSAVGGVVLGQLFELTTIGWSLAVAGGLLAAFGIWRLATRRALVGFTSAASSSPAE